MIAPKVLVYGSCVSRDIFRVVDTDFEVVHYIARQSWISAFNMPLPHPGDPGLASQFRNSALIGDFTSDAPARIQTFAPQTDIALFDITTDRWGVVPIAAGGYLSYTAGLRRSRLLKNHKHGKVINFFSDLHFSLFAEAAAALRDELSALDLLHKSVILGYPFTDRAIDGSEVPTSQGLTADQWNEGFRRYYDLVETLGFPVLHLPNELALTSPDHAWGPAQNHFIDDAYRWWAGQLSDFAIHEVSHRALALKFSF